MRHKSLFTFIYFIVPTQRAVAFAMALFCIYDLVLKFVNVMYGSTVCLKNTAPVMSAVMRELFDKWKTIYGLSLISISTE